MRDIKKYFPFARRLKTGLTPFGYLDWSAICAVELSDEISAYPAKIAACVTNACEDDLATISTASPYHHVALLRERMARGGKCLIARVDGKIAAFNWYVRGNARDEGFRVRLDREHVFCMDAHTFEPFRGQGLHTHLLSLMMLDARECGFARAYTRVEIANEASWKSHLRLGWKTLGSTFMFYPRFNFPRRVIFGPSIYPLFRPTRKQS